MNAASIQTKREAQALADIDDSARDVCPHCGSPGYPGSRCFQCETPIPVVPKYDGISKFDVALDQTSTPVPELSEDDLLEEILLAHGIEPKNISPRLINALELWADRRLASLILGWIDQLGNSTHGLSLRLFFFGEKKSLRTAAKEIGVSHNAVHKSLKFLREKIQLRKRG